MNRILKILIKEILHNNIVYHTKDHTGDKYLVLDKNKNEILSVNNGWAINHYSVYVNKKPMLSVKWDESKSKPLTNDQKDTLDIINACKEKIDFQETAQTMTAEELSIANFLQKSLCDIKH